jgi:hypothetical protein
MEVRRGMELQHHRCCMQVYGGGGVWSHLRTAWRCMEPPPHSMEVYGATSAPAYTCMEVQTLLHLAIPPLLHLATPPLLEGVWRWYSHPPPPPPLRGKSSYTA